MQRNILRFSARFKEALRSGFKVLPKHSRFFDQYMKVIYFYQQTQVQRQEQTVTRLEYQLKDSGSFSVQK